MLLALTRRAGHYALVAAGGVARTGREVSRREQPNHVPRKQALIVTAMSAFTILLGVCVFGYRTDNTFLGDGHIGFSAVLLSGAIVLLPILSLTAYSPCGAATGWLLR